MIRTVELDGTEPTILRILRGRNLLDPAKLEAYREAKARGDDIPERILVRTGLATEREIAAAYAGHLTLPLLDPSSEAVGSDKDFIRLLPEKLCRDQLIVPVAVRDETVDL